jgi:uncharacterized membrane protein YcaP (DUF421 family)
MLARAVNGSAGLVPTLAGGFVLLLLHRGLAELSARFHFLGMLIKGRSDLVIENGRILEKRAKSNCLSERDLLEDVRLNGKVASIAQVGLAYFERNGSVSVIPKKE